MNNNSILIILGLTTIFSDCDCNPQHSPNYTCLYAIELWEVGSLHFNKSTDLCPINLEWVRISDLDDIHLKRCPTLTSLGNKMACRGSYVDRANNSRLETGWVSIKGQNKTCVVEYYGEVALEDFKVLSAPTGQFAWAGRNGSDVPFPHSALEVGFWEDEYFGAFPSYLCRDKIKGTYMFGRYPQTWEEDGSESVCYVAYNGETYEIKVFDVLIRI